MANRGDKKVAIAVRISVEKDNNQVVAIQEELAFVGEGMAARLKNTPGCFGSIA